MPSGIFADSITLGDQRQLTLFCSDGNSEDVCISRRVEVLISNDSLIDCIGFIRDA